VAFDEKSVFQEKPETRPAKYACPRCKRTNEYSIRWMRRTKRKDRQPQSGEDRAKFDKLRDHLLRLDDEVTCKTCGKKFEVPSLHSLLFTDQLDGLPKDEESEPTEDAPPAAPIDRAKLPARFTRPTKGWRG
jgi:DNA-directed RNA polymerase subunit M/transcription elongation factor TFIIS